MQRVGKVLTIVPWHGILIVSMASSCLGEDSARVEANNLHVAWWHVSSHKLQKKSSCVLACAVVQIIRCHVEIVDCDCGYVDQVLMVEETF
jgi:hypothetical protein